MKKKISDKQLAEVLWSFTKEIDEKEIEERITSFVQYLYAHELLHRSRAVINSFRDVARAAEGRELLTIETAKPLSDKTVQNIQNFLHLSKTDVVVKENPALLGGAIARTKDTVYDMSIRMQLQKLTESLTH